MSLNPTKPFPYYESLSLVHPKLINWDTIEPHRIPNFYIGHEVFIYLNVVEPSHQQRIEERNIVGYGINYLSHTRTSQAFHNLNDHYQVVADLKKKIETNRSDAS